MLEAAVLPHAFGQHLLARMSEGRMPEIMRERDRLRQILIQRERPRDRAADRRHLESMRQARPQMIAPSRSEKPASCIPAGERRANE